MDFALVSPSDHASRTRPGSNRRGELMTPYDNGPDQMGTGPSVVTAQQQHVAVLGAGPRASHQRRPGPNDLTRGRLPA